MAREANQVIVLRRGPSKYTQMLVWDLSTDQVTPGQWLKGRVYEKRCDVSPDGKHFVGCCSNYSQSHRKRFAGTANWEGSWIHCGWTVVSHPPYFTAVGLWLTGGAWNGGGVWKSNKHLAVNNFPHCWEERQSPKGIQVSKLNLPMSEDDVYELLLQQRGWKQQVILETEVVNPDWRERSKEMFGRLEKFLADPSLIGEALACEFASTIPQFRTSREGVWQKEFEKGRLFRRESHDHEVWGLVSDRNQLVREWRPKRFQAHWIDVDNDDRPIFGDNGCLWRWRRFPDGEPRMIADLNSNKFENIAPPS
ncbi:MAG: hypothetical protein IT205_10335 [Fimbriimonadaceae bacterium]|nr:hypothetical protein [Fimbriimonadaceae bacterium]